MGVEIGAIKLLQRSSNSVVPGSKPLGSSMVDSAFHHSKVDQVSIRNTFSPLNGTAALRQMNPIHKKGAIRFFKKKVFIPHPKIEGLHKKPEILDEGKKT